MLRQLLRFILRVLVGAGIGCFVLLILFLIVAKMTLPDKREVRVPEPRIMAQVWVRNQTRSPLVVTLPLARSSVPMDTVWWGVDIAPEAIGRAILAPGLTIEGVGYYPGAIPLEGSEDTLVAHTRVDFAPSGRVGKRKLFYPERNLPVWKQRLRNYKPVIEESVRLRLLPRQPDSVMVVIRLAPGGTFLVAQQVRMYNGAKESPAEAIVQAGFTADGLSEEMYPFAVYATLHWMDSRHRPHQHRLTATDIHAAFPTKPDSVDLTSSRTIHYIDYR